LPVGFYWTEGNRGVGWAVDAVPTLKGGSGWGIPSPPAVLLPDGRVVKPGIQAAERLQGLPADWTQPAVQAEGVRPQDRWRLVGNAVCAEVAQWIGGLLAAPTAVDPAIFGEKLGQGRWPDAACSSDEGPRAVKCSDWPVSREHQSIVSFLGSDASSLSVRATDGFVGRVVRACRNGKLRIPEPFVERLRQHSLRVAREAAGSGPEV
jgi:DNA (cytosine-5)-methyltransferase 1